MSDEHDTPGAVVAHEIGEEVSQAIRVGFAKMERGEQPTGLSDIIELAIRRRCEVCQKDGGAMHALAREVEKIGVKVEAAVATLNVRRGEKSVWRIIRVVSVPVMIFVATIVLNHLGQKRAEVQAARQSAEAAEVARELREFRAAYPIPAVVEKPGP